MVMTRNDISGVGYSERFRVYAMSDGYALLCFLVLFLLFFPSCGRLAFLGIYMFFFWVA